MNRTKIFDISLPNLQAAFERMRNEAGWNTNEKLFWGYYFLDHNINKLEKFSKELKKTGLQIVEMRNTGDNNLFILHAEEYAVHEPQSLFEQCQKLAKLANENNIEIFDGWDVEQIQTNKELVE